MILLFCGVVVVVAFIVSQIGTFRFYAEDENEYKLWLPAFSENTKEVYNPYA